MGRNGTGDCLIVGGGIIGLSIAYELSRRGVDVTLIEQGEWGGQASQAAAGILAPLKEFSQPGPLLEIGMKSLALYPQWVAQLEQETGLDVQLAIDGLLTVALNRQEYDMLRKKYTWQKEHGYPVEWVEGSALYELEPLLSRGVIAAIYSPSEGHISNKLLLQALVKACRARGVRLLSGTVATGLICQEGRVFGLETSAGPFRAEQTVITAGAWSGLIAGWLGLHLPVRPVRGQVAAVSSENCLLRRVIFGGSGYIVPKKDGRVVLGATEDEAGFNRDVTLAGLAAVLNGTLPYIPSLRTASFLQAWAGLRPATPDQHPLLGPLPEWEGISIASAHYRNGILLSPITAMLMADWLTRGVDSPLEPFLAKRFLG